MADAPHPVDLPALWAKLGVVSLADGATRLLGDAPMAALRRAMLA